MCEVIAESAGDKAVGIVVIDVAMAGFVSAQMGFQATVGDGAHAQPGFVPISEGRSDLSNWFVMSAVKA